MPKMFIIIFFILCFQSIHVLFKFNYHVTEYSAYDKKKLYYIKFNGNFYIIKAY